jgi:ATPase family associated with various cellular activities (AAA)/Peptidase family M41
MTTIEKIQPAPMTATRPPNGGPVPKPAPIGSPASEADGLPAAIGPLELAHYRRVWRESFSFRRRTEQIAAKRERERAISKAREDTREDDDDEDDDHLPKRSASSAVFDPVDPVRAAAALTFARLFDRRPVLLEGIRSGAPVVVIDVADPQMLRHVSAVWRETLFDDLERQMDIDGDRLRRREKLDAVYLVVKEPPKGKTIDTVEKAASDALALALPLLAISPLATTHLPEVLIAAATDRIEFPPLDATTISRTIRIVTGRRSGEPLEADLVAQVTLGDLAIAVRFDRTPTQCVAELRRLSAARNARPKERYLPLSELYGLGDARAWAEAAIADIKAWKSGAIPWSAVTSAVALNGPPGCGKTSFAAAFAREAGLHMVSATLARWQSSGEAHLGHLLRAMKSDFQEARSKAPACIFIDEIDSFPDRAGITHAYRDYVVEVVNALLAEIDGIQGREGVVVIGASNDIRRCDPALLRAGRLDRVVNIGLPDIEELARMFRVRLNGYLAKEDLAGVAELALGMVGADVERVVKDAFRAARQDGGRGVTLADLRKALAGDDDRSEEARWRTCVHEASHIVVDVLHFGPADVFATTTTSGSRGGMSMRTKLARPTGTAEEYRRRLQVILAGREGEEMILGNVSHGAGGMAGSDLHMATGLAAAMIGSFGLTGRSHLLYLGSSRNSGDFLMFAEIRESVAGELSDAAGACRVLLEENRAGVEVTSRRLLEKGRIDGAEVARILEDHRRAPPGENR